MSPALFSLLTIFALLPAILFGLECKQGYEERPAGTKFAEVAKCRAQENAKYCVAITCTTDEVAGFANIFWQCETVQNKTSCAERSKKNVEKNTGLKKVSCECSYGAKEEDNGNAQCTLPTEPSIPTEKNALKCKMGLIDGKKLGTVYSNYCFKEKRYCAAANCSTIDGLQKLTVWHCSETNDCNEIETLLKKELGITFICKCLFGAKDVDLSNEQLMLSHLFPPMITKTDGGDVGGGNGTPPVTPTEAATTVYTTDGSPSLTPNASTEGENHSFRPTVANLWLIFVLLTLGLLVS